VHVHGVISRFMVPSNSQMKEPRHWFHEETLICLLRHWSHEGTLLYQIWSNMTFLFRGRQFILLMKFDLNDPIAPINVPIDIAICQKRPAWAIQNL
jgi:hypothetical protein